MPSPSLSYRVGRSPAPRALAPTVAAALLALVAAGAFAAPATRTSFTERYPLGGGDVAVYNLAGTVSLEPTDGSETVVQLSRAGRDAERLKVRVDMVDGRQALRVIYPESRVVYPDRGRGNRTTLRVHGDGTFGNDRDGFWPNGRLMTIVGSGSGFEGHADIRILVPRGKDVLVRLAVGSVSAARVDSRLAVDVSCGPIEASRTRGPLRLETSSGEVRVQDVQGELVVETGSGEVTVNGAKGSDVKLESGSGEIRAENLEAASVRVETGSGEVTMASIRSPQVSVETGSGGVGVDLTSAIDDLDVGTGSGSVRLDVPPNVSALLSLETGSGDFDVQLPVTDLHREQGELRAQLGDGRGRIRVETGSGSIRIGGRAAKSD